MSILFLLFASFSNETAWFVDSLFNCNLDTRKFRGRWFLYGLGRKRNVTVAFPVGIIENVVLPCFTMFYPVSMLKVHKSLPPRPGQSDEFEDQTSVCVDSSM